MDLCFDVADNRDADVTADMADIQNRANMATQADKQNNGRHGNRPINRIMADIANIQNQWQISLNTFSVQKTLWEKKRCR